MIALKNEFLPKNYDYQLFSDVSERRQKPNETFAEYITHMNALFNCLSILITQEHKLYIVQKNLLQKYAQAVAPFDVRSIADLSELCRRVDNATMSTQRKSISLPFEQLAHPNFDFRQNRQPYLPNRNNVCNLELNREMVPEVCALRNRRNENRPNEPNQERAQNIIDPEAPNWLVCWNCQEHGHSFRECPKPRTGVFCYKCGTPNNVVHKCRHCAGNANGNREI